LGEAPEISHELAWHATELRGEHVRLIAPGDVHLTLVALWNETSITEAIEKIRLTVSGFSPFTLEVKHLNYGPDPKRPRLLWAECGTPDEITRLRDALLGLFNQSDDRPFRLRITLARLPGIGAKIARRRPIDRELSFTQQVTAVVNWQFNGVCSHGDDGVNGCISIRHEQSPLAVSVSEVRA
jgi:2'-5' RNA ligase